MSIAASVWSWKPSVRVPTLRPGPCAITPVLEIMWQPLHVTGRNFCGSFIAKIVDCHSVYVRSSATPAGVTTS